MKYEIIRNNTKKYGIIWFIVKYETWNSMKL
jgi:hypothetical protein